MVTLRVKDNSSQARAFLNYVKTLAFVEEMPEAKVAKKKVVAKKTAARKDRISKQKLIMQLSKETNRAATKRMFAYHGMPYPYDSNNR